MKQLKKYFYRDNLLSISSQTDENGLVSKFIAEFNGQVKEVKVENYNFLEAWKTVENWLDKNLEAYAKKGTIDF